jgi:hypothetical protein
MLAGVSDRVFITSQIAGEVNKNKVGVAHQFLDKHFNGLGQEFSSIGKGLPDQLFIEAVTEDLGAKLKAIRNRLKELRIATDKAVDDLLQLIGRSEDEVSPVLNRIFDRAVDASPSELGRARERKERGWPPGKPDNSLGDQINWEQLLGCAEKWPQVWIISNDRDYCHKYANTAVLNAVLYRELTQKRPDILVHCFTEFEKGLRNFVNTMQVPNVQLPAPDVADQINKAQNALPSFSLIGYDDSAIDLMLQQRLANQRSHDTLMFRNITPLDNGDLAIPTAATGPAE